MAILGQGVFLAASASVGRLQRIGDNASPAASYGGFIDLYAGSGSLNLQANFLAQRGGRNISSTPKAFLRYTEKTRTVTQQLTVF
jgi:hypothetical protein